MKIVIIGDVHRDWNTVRYIADREKPDTMLCTGDLQTYEDPGRITYFVPGNHENWDLIDGLMSVDFGGDPPVVQDYDAIEVPNVYPINSNEYVNLDGCTTVAGLGRNYSPARFDMQRKSLKGDRRRHFVKEDVERCKNLVKSDRKIDIFLSHECPVALNICRGSKNLGVEYIDEIIRSLKPKYAFSGHHHTFKEGRLGETVLVGLDRLSNSYLTLDTSDFNITRQKLDNGSTTAKGAENSDTV